jgi:hypothetical protein
MACSGTVLLFTFTLLEKIKTFLAEKGQLLSRSQDASPVLDLDLPKEICMHMNDLHRKLQGTCQVVSKLYNNISAFWKKLFHS